MSRVLREKHKIRNSVIESIFIYMMNDFLRFKVSPKIFLQHKTRTFYITIYIGIWMRFVHYIHIAICNSLSTMPSVVFASRFCYAHSLAGFFRHLKSSTCNACAFLRTKWSISFRWNRVKDFFAHRTSLFDFRFFTPRTPTRNFLVFVPRSLGFFKSRFWNYTGMFSFMPRNVSLGKTSFIIVHIILLFHMMDYIRLRGGCQ